jgi:hypothetical protein
MYAPSSLKAYVRDADPWIGPRRLSGQRRVWVRVQGSQSGDGRGRGHQADQAGGPAEERIANDRGIRTPYAVEFHA